MTAEQIIIESALTSWKSNVARATKYFVDLSEDEGQKPVAPGRNRIIYLLGHLTAIHDGMIPLLRVGERLHPELADVFIATPDRAVADHPPLEDLKNFWATVNSHLLALMQQDTSLSWWAERHASASEEDFRTNPNRNRLSILLGRTNHLSYHLGQIALAPEGPDE